MLGTFRQAMTWLHTWFGMVLGFVLMAVFFFGSLSVFHGAIDRWSKPETRGTVEALPSFDAVLKPLLERLQPSEEDVQGARERGAKISKLPLSPTYWSTWGTDTPAAGLYAEFALENPNKKHDYVYAQSSVDLRTGEPPSREGFGLGGELFYPLHYSLTLHRWDLGIWIVGVAALMMLVALLTGVVIHQKIFREFFTFRPQKLGQRRLLDLHNLTGVVALPFHFVFAFTGLVIFGGIYFPVTETLFEEVAERHEQAAKRTQSLPTERANVPAPLASVDAMITEAKRRWAGQGDPRKVAWIELRHPGDQNGYVSIFPASGGRLASGGGGLHFDAKSGRFLHENQSSSIRRVMDYLIGIHLMPFEHALLKWFMFLGGLVSCACIATGLMFFVGKRRRRHAARGAAGARWVDALAVTAVTGMLVATATVLVFNRLLPRELPDAGDWQVRAFWLAWFAAGVHASIRTAPVKHDRLSPAWREQCWAIAALATAAAVSNWATTGDHLLRSITAGHWSLAGVDLSLLASALIALFAATRLRRREAAAAALSEELTEPSPARA